MHFHSLFHFHIQPNGYCVWALLCPTCMCASSSFLHFNAIVNVTLSSSPAYDEFVMKELNVSRSFYLCIRLFQICGMKLIIKIYTAQLNTANIITIYECILYTILICHHRWLIHIIRYFEMYVLHSNCNAGPTANTPLSKN